MLLVSQGMAQCKRSLQQHIDFFRQCVFLFHMQQAPVKIKQKDSDTVYTLIALVASAQ